MAAVATSEAEEQRGGISRPNGIQLSRDEKTL
jgi:sugar lactone lactonase YvrE